MAKKDWRAVARASAKRSKDLWDLRRRESEGQWERLLDDPNLAGRVDFCPGEETGVGRVDRVTAEELGKLRLQYERDRDAIRPLRAAVQCLFVNAVTRASSGLAAPHWPAWVVCGVDHVLWELWSNEDTTRRKGRTGRHAKEITRRLADLRDFERAQAVNAAMSTGLSLRAACKEASRTLTGPAAGSEKVMWQSYKRVAHRFPRDPSRYTR